MSVIVSFSGRCRFLNQQNRNLFRELISHILTDVKTSVQLNYVFCTDDELLEINRQFLQHDYYTDIVTFGLEVTPHNIVGEIYISKDRIKENAVHYKVSEEEELVRVFSHGMLHLLGYKDKTTQEAATMRKEEERCLSLWRSIKGVSRETISI